MSLIVKSSTIRRRIILLLTIQFINILWIDSEIVLLNKKFIFRVYKNNSGMD